jgi:RNA polymerase sigma factor (sigma-70 family)
MNDSELLLRFAREHDEPAFTELVRRHAGLVRSIALRACHGNDALAHDVTQRVFITLARKAARLAAHPALLGWLHRAARLEALAAHRAAARRAAREAAAASHLLPEPDSGPDWRAVAPLLDEALGRLSAADREAVLARHVVGLPYATVGQRLGLRENAARMRTERAVEKLRDLLARRGIVSTAAALGASLSLHAAAHPAPPALVADLASRALAETTPAASAGAGLGGILAALLRSPAFIAATLSLLLLGTWVYLDSPTNSPPTPATLATASPRPSAPPAGHSPATATAAKTPPPAARFANERDFETWARAVLNAAHPDEAHALLRQRGFALDRSAFGPAYAEARLSWQAGGLGSMGAGYHLAPYFNAWRVQDLDAAARWLLGGKLPEAAYGEWVKPLLAAARAAPDTLAAWVADFAGHPLHQDLKANLLWVRQGPRAALDFMSGPDYKVAKAAHWSPGRPPMSEVFDSWFEAAPHDAVAWTATLADRFTRGSILLSLGKQSAGPDGQLAHSAALDLLGGLKGEAMEDALGLYLNTLSFRNPSLGARLALQTSGADDPRNWIDQSLQNWAQKDPAGALAFVREQALPTGKLAAVARGWLQKDSDAVRLWALSLPEAEGATAKDAILAALQTTHPERVREMAASLGVSSPRHYEQTALLFLTGSDPDTALAWLRSQPADDARRELARGAASALAGQDPARALEVLAEFAATPDARMAFDLSAGMAYDSPEVLPRWIAALPAGSAERRAAVAGVLAPGVERGYDTVRSAAERWLREPAAVDDALFRIAESIQGKPLLSTPARAEFAGRVVASLEFAAQDTARRQQAGWFAISQLQNHWTPQQLIDWAGTIRDREVASGVRAALEMSGMTFTSGQRAALDRLPAPPAHLSLR